MATASSSSLNQSTRVRIRTLHVCEPSFPSRDVRRKDNYARRQVQKDQGWSCPMGVPYQGIDPIHPSPRTSKVTTNETLKSANPARRSLQIPNNAPASTRPKSGSVGQQEDHVIKSQFESTIRHLQSAQQKYIKKSSDILKGVRHGHSVKDVMERLPRQNSSRAVSVDIRRSSMISSDDKDSDVFCDTILDDFEDEEMNGSSVSEIRDDIMSPSTITPANIGSTNLLDVSELRKSHPTPMPAIPMKSCQSAPPLNRNNIREATLRPFTPRFNSLSSRLRLTKHMPFRDALYRQLCCILWLLRSMGRPDWSEMISGCWNINQWLRTDSRANVHYQQQQAKKQHEPLRGSHGKVLLFETKSASIDASRENAIASLRATTGLAHNLKKHRGRYDSTSLQLVESISDDQASRRSIYNDASEQVDVQLNSVLNADSDLNESISSREINQADITDYSTIDMTQSTMNFRSPAGTSAFIGVNTRRSSAVSNPAPLIGPTGSARPVPFVKRQRDPDALLKRWIQNQKIRTDPSQESLPISESQVRLLRVGDNEDLKRIFGLENAADTNKGQIRRRHTRDRERRLVTNIRPRPTTSIGSAESRQHAETLSKIKRDFNDFTEEQSIILNNKLEQVDNERLFYCQSKLRELQQHMPSLTILDRVLKQLRFDQNKKKVDATHLKYQSWYIDLLQLVQPDYSDDPIILLLLKEMEEFANPGDKPTIIRFKFVLGGLRTHEICHPDVMAAIEFIRIHALRMSNEEFDKFFYKQFPAMAACLVADDEAGDNNLPA